MDNREVTEFIIVPPYNARDAVCRAKERFTDFLTQKFPGYAFKVVSVAPVDDEDVFNVIPVVSFDDEGEMRMCIYPKLQLVADIARACSKFEISPDRRSGITLASVSTGQRLQ